MILTLPAQLCIHLLILSSLVLSRDHDIHCIHYLALTFLISTCDHIPPSHPLSCTCLFNDINQAGVAGGDW